ncbi:MAG: hypothetical protein IPP40_02105 [bacterium]|nr:hypothetical protein [bacterium]
MIPFALFFVLIATLCHGTTFYVVNGLDESLGWVNSDSGEFDAQAVTLGSLANDVVVTNDKLFVVNSGLGTLQVIDRQSLTTLDEITVTGSVNPYSASALSNSRVAVTGLISGTVSIVNVEFGNVDTTFITGDGPQAIVEHSGLIYVLNTGVVFPVFHPGLLKRYNAETYVFVDSLELGINPQSMAFIGNELHVLCTGDYANITGSVQIVNLETMSISQTLEFGGSPGAIAANGNEVFIAAGGWVEAGYVFHYNASTRQVINDASNPILCGVGASDIVVQPNGDFVVTCFQDATVEFSSADGVVRTVYNMSAGAGSLGVWWGASDVDETLPEIAQDMNILSAFPNPFNSSVMLEWTGPLRAPNQIQIFDVLGRNVGELAIGAGTPRVGWTPGSDGRQEVAAGVYFARFVEGATSLPIRIVYIK